MSSFTLESPAPVTRSRGRSQDARVGEALDFAAANSGEWFVYLSEDLEGDTSKEEVNKSRARITQKTSRLRKAGKDRGLTIEITTRRDGATVKGYARNAATTEDDK